MKPTPPPANPSHSAWGDETTQYFFELTPDRVLDAVETSGLKCTGRCSALNSFENRVYEVELEEDGGQTGPLARRRVVKFYRPGRWSSEQILEEHRFLLDLQAAEVPAVAPLPFAGNGETLQRTPSGISYALFPKVGGRAPDELSDAQLPQIGRLLARMHAVGAQREAPARVKLGPDTYGEANLEYLLKSWLPLEYRTRYEAAVRAILKISSPWFAGASVQRVHGDCHPGNLLHNGEHFFFVDFDDMVRSVPAQDIWLLVPGRDRASLQARELLLEGYEEMRSFDRRTLRLIEPLRALRFIHYTAWIARRWQDPAFPQAFPEFNTHHYWADETSDLERQLAVIREQADAGN
jgi:Ser/Thr protein kinase RdoA (MazF antagonist)